MRKVSVCEPEAGRFRGQLEKVPPDWTSSVMEMSRTPWPPVCDPEMPVITRSCALVPCPWGRGNLFALLLPASGDGGLPHFWVALHVLAWFMQAGL